MAQKAQVVTKKCWYCKGTGKTSKCTGCHGEGRYHKEGWGMVKHEQCNGTGKQRLAKCYVCEGTGKLRKHPRKNLMAKGQWHYAYLLRKISLPAH